MDYFLLGWNAPTTGALSRRASPRGTALLNVRMYALASPELLYVDPHLDAEMRTPYVPLTKRRGAAGGEGGVSSTGEEGETGATSSEGCKFLAEGGAVSEAAAGETAAALVRECGLSKRGEGPSADSSDVSAAAAAVSAPGTLGAVGRPRSSRFPPLRVGFMSKFFGIEVLIHNSGGKVRTVWSSYL